MRPGVFSLPRSLLCRAARELIAAVAATALAAAAGCVEARPFPTTGAFASPKGPNDERAAAVPAPTAESPAAPAGADRDLVRVPAACFVMGSNDGDHDEAPPHEVCLDAFWLDRVEVSNERYARCVEAGHCVAADSYPRRPELSLPDRPVVGVSWVDADRFCRFEGMRLPTEAEWELAAAGTDGRTYPWGDERPTCERAVSAHCPPHSTVPVSSYPGGASPSGALHMAGNAWEWVADWWAPYYYRRGPRQSPPGPERGRMRAIRGGCWNRSMWHLRVADRDSGVIGLRNDHVGFRCACSDCAGVAARP